MRIKLKRVILLTGMIAGLWLVIILMTPPPSSSDAHVKQQRRERHQSGPGDSKQAISVANRKNNLSDDTIKGRLDQSYEKGGSDIKDIGQKELQQGEEDFVDIKNDEEVDRDGEQKEISRESQIENIPVDTRSEGQNPITIQNDSHPLELDLLPNLKPKASRQYRELWSKAASWVNSSQIYPASAKELGSILHAMAYARIERADVGFKGTQLKARLLLEGGQAVVFKPKRYSRDHVIYGTPYAGYDRHNGEIAAFHLDRVLNFRQAPLVVGRRVNLKTDILPVASPALKETFLKQDGNTCFYGKCYYCKPDDPACGEGDMMEGSVTLWLPPELKLKKWRHLWSRTYKPGKQAKWEVDDKYCIDLMRTRLPPDRHPLVPQMIDAAIFDYLIGNADRHMYETFEKDDDRGMMLLMDNAKSFGNPYIEERTILAPLYQCCRVKRRTWAILQQYKDGHLSHVMKQVLSHDPVAPVLTNWHLEALDRRLNDILKTINDCFAKEGEDVVLL